MIRSFKPHQQRQVQICHLCRRPPVTTIGRVTDNRLRRRQIFQGQCIIKMTQPNQP